MAPGWVKFRPKQPVVRNLHHASALRLELGRVPKEENENIVSLRNNRIKGSAPRQQGCDAPPSRPLLVKAG